MERTGVQVETGRSQGSLSASSGFLQRQCACGTHTMGGGQCAECQKTKIDIGGRPLQAKLALSPPGDRYEQEADRIALEHAVPMAGSGWLAERPGLDVAHAKSGVGSMLGVDLGDVKVRSTVLTGAPVGTMARTRSRTVEIEPEVFRPSTPIGQALLAHELTHVVQQMPEAPLPEGLGDAHRDRYQPVGKAPAGMEQHCISCSSCERSAPAPASATTFADVQRTYRTTTDATVRSSTLDLGVATARSNASRLYRNSTRPPVSTLRESYERETGIRISYDNPFTGVSQDHVERAYRAWAENPTQSDPPWVLLAIWVKEGLPETEAETRNSAGIPANSDADARAIYRSLVYFMNMGADVYIAHTAVAGGDNRADFAAGTGAAHDTNFRDQITRQVRAGRLPRDISGEIDATMSVASAGPGRYRVTATPRFQELSLMLVDAFYREQRDALVADPRVGANPDPGLVYMRWNMRSSTFNNFLNRTPNADPDGTTPSLTDWAFHRQVRETEYGQSRRNAIRFKYLLEVFQHVYEDTP